MKSRFEDRGRNQPEQGVAKHAGPFVPHLQSELADLGILRLDL